MGDRRERLDSQVEYWNTTGSSKRFGHPVNLERLGALLAPSSCIVDYGCGYGRVLQILSEAGYRDLAEFDIAAAMVSAARARVPRARVETMAAPGLPVPDASADAVLIFTVLTCVPGDDGQRAIVREARRVLRPGGLLYISDLWLQPDERNRARYRAGEGRFGTHGVFELADGVVLRHHERGWIDELTRAFARIAVDEIRVETMNGNSAEAFQWFGQRP